MIKNIIFDYGGVLVQKGKLNRIKEKLAQLLFSGKSKAKETNLRSEIQGYWNLWKTDQLSEREFFEKARAKYKIRYPIFLIKRHLYSAHQENTELFNLIKVLKKRYKIYLLTNHARAWYDRQEKELNFSRLFDGIVTSFQEKIAKPDVKIYKILIKRYKLNPKECLFIDDQDENLKVARKLGMKTVHYTSNKPLKEELKKSGII